MVSVVAGHQQGRPSHLPHSGVAGPSPMPGCRFLLFLPKDQHQKHLETQICWLFAEWILLSRAWLSSGKGAQSMTKSASTADTWKLADNSTFQKPKNSPDPIGHPSSPTSPTGTHCRTPHLQTFQVKGQTISKRAELPEYGPISSLGDVKPATDAYSIAKGVLSHTSPRNTLDLGRHPPLPTCQHPGPPCQSKGPKERVGSAQAEDQDLAGGGGWRLCSCTYLPGREDLLDVIQVDAIPIF